MSSVENSSRIAQKQINFSLAKPVSLVLQSEVAECGLASMAMIASYHGHQLDMPAMRKRFSANLNCMEYNFSCYRFSFSLHTEKNK